MMCTPEKMEKNKPEINKKLSLQIKHNTTMILFMYRD